MAHSVVYKEYLHQSLLLLKVTSMFDFGSRQEITGMRAERATTECTATAVPRWYKYGSKTCRVKVRE